MKATLSYAYCTADDGEMYHKLTIRGHRASERMKRSTYPEGSARMIREKQLELVSLLHLRKNEETPDSAGDEVE